MTIKMDKAKSQLSKLVKKTMKGKKVAITNTGRPYLDFVTDTASCRPRSPGHCGEQIRMSVDFDEAVDEIVAGFEGNL